MKKNRSRLSQRCFPVIRLDHVLRARFAIEHQIDHYKNHDDRQDLIEEVTPDVYGNLGPDDCSNHGRQTKIDAVGKGVDSFASKTRNRKDVLNEDRHPVRPVGNSRRKAQKDQHRQGEQRASARHDVDHSSDESNKGQKEKFDFHETNLGRKYYFKSNALELVMPKELPKNLEIVLQKQKRVLYLRSQFCIAECLLGEMAEWSNALVLKTSEGHTSGGSNPSFSAEKKPKREFRFFCFEEFVKSLLF